MGIALLFVALPADLCFLCALQAHMQLYIQQGDPFFYICCLWRNVVRHQLLVKDAKILRSYYIFWFHFYFSEFQEDVMLGIVYTLPLPVFCF